MNAAVVRGLRRSYGDRPATDGLDLTIGRGEFVVLLGEKRLQQTTLLRALAGLDPVISREPGAPLEPFLIR